MIRLLLIASAIAAVSCSPCKRVSKVLAKCPTAATDTVTVVIDDTVYVEGIQVDTIFNCGDTIILDSGRVRVELMPYYVRTTDTAYIRYAVQAECKPDTIIQEGQIIKQVITNTKQAAIGWPERNVWTIAAVSFCLGILSIVMIALFLRKR